MANNGYDINAPPSLSTLLLLLSYVLRFVATLQLVFKLRFFSMLNASMLPFTVATYGPFVRSMLIIKALIGLYSAEVSGAAMQDHLLLPLFVHYYKTSRNPFTNGLNI